MAAPNPTSPGLYCDPLFRTSIIPSVGTGGETKATLAASINGVVFPFSNPTSQAQMITFVNSVMSGVAYSSPSGFDCRIQCLGSRYVIMGGGATPNAADQLYVSPTGEITYIPTDWRSPPF
jgi:hypothetical protein